MMNTDLTHLLVDTQKQQMFVYQAEQLIATYAVSTAKNGTGSLENSGCTPLGKHRIAEKFGDGLPQNAVFVARQFTGELYDDELGRAFAERDWILGRIMWLDGCENGMNQGQNADGLCVDSKSRYIYIHGTPDTEPMGMPLSHGCVRMRMSDVVQLYEQVVVGTIVQII